MDTTTVALKRPRLIANKSVEWLRFKEPIPRATHFFDKLELAPDCGRYKEYAEELRKYDDAVKFCMKADVVLIVSVRSLAKFIALAQCGVLGESYEGPTPMFSPELLAVIAMNSRAEAVEMEGKFFPCDAGDTALVFENSRCVADLS